jgi:hypothetical protein
MCPYIKQEERKDYKKLLNDIINIFEFHGYNPGNLNYLICKLVMVCLQEEGISYTNANKWIGALECAKLEIYRKIISKYEDEKCKENGEVFK